MHYLIMLDENHNNNKQSSQDDCRQKRKLETINKNLSGFNIIGTDIVSA